MAIIYTQDELEKHELLNYIDFQRICEDYDLDEGGLTPGQHMHLQDILIEFIIQNKWQNQDE